MRVFARCLGVATIGEGDPGRSDMTFPPPAESCLPPILHPVSRHILELFLKGWLPEEEFRRLFSLPNSDYLLVSECILRQLMS